MRYAISNEYNENIRKWKEQNPKENSFRVEIDKIVYHIVGEVTIYLKPIFHIKNETELLAKENCNTCKGNGYISYWYAQDESITAPCPICFPDNKKAIEAKENWDHYNK
jgi:hypothetical protein